MCVHYYGCGVHVCVLLSVLFMCVYYWECAVHVCALLGVCCSVSFAQNLSVGQYFSMT